MKKFLALALFLALVTSSGVFALDNNFGFGFGGNWATASGNDGRADWSMDRYGGYAFLFFGISRFIELNLGYMEKFPQGITYAGSYYGAGGYDENSGALQLGIYGKYPIPLGSRFVFFPTAGADFEFSLGDDWWHDLWLRGGVGMDIFLGERFFLRTHLLAGYALPIGGIKDEMGVESSWGAQIKFGIGWMF